ncbi:MAG: Clp1/GlmU family protein [Candidatus Nezhaarchaeales archaeon]
MKRIREKRGTIIKIEGPAGLRVLEGCISILGSTIKPKEQVVIPRYKSLVVEFIEDSIIELRLGGEAKVETLMETLTPLEWRSAVEAILSHSTKPISCIVLGDVDSGKTIFCTYLANCAVSKGLKVGIVDKDPGQTEISIPTTIGLGLIEKPIYSLENVEAVSARFVGSVSPANIIQRVIAATKQLYDEAVSKGCDIIVINTSGWISGRGARELKYGVISTIRPNYMVLIQRTNEVEHLVKPFEKSDINIIRVHPSSAVKLKTKEERKARRESIYRNYFANAKVRKISLSSIRVMYSLFTTGAVLSNVDLEKYDKETGLHLIYGEECRDSLFLVNREPVQGKTKMEEEIARVHRKEEVLLTWIGEERGLLVGLLGPDLSYVGLGLIREIDYLKRSIELLTPVETTIGVIQVGLIKLDDDFKEVAKYDRTPL